MSARCANRCRHAFTLIEILVATFCMAVLLAALAIPVRGALRERERASEAGEESLRLRRALDRVVVDLDGLLETLVDLHDVAIDDHGIDLNLIRENTGEIVIQGLEDRIVQVFRNLIGNAVSFSPDNASITLRISTEDAWVKICVEDEGPGLPPGTEESIFDRFYQERPDSEKFGTHSGLGLSISKQIIDVHGGEISAQNLINEAGDITGACFIVRLPQAE